jgi:hypothetical protein
MLLPGLDGCLPGDDDDPPVSLEANGLGDVW